MQLNSQQKDATKAPLTGIHLVEALAGSGKTTLLRHRAKYLLRAREQEGDYNSKILIMAFNKDVRTTLKEKLEQDLTPTEYKRLDIETFHSAALGMIGSFRREHLPHIASYQTVDKPRDITTITKDWLAKKGIRLKESQINTLIGVYEESTCLNISVKEVFVRNPRLSKELKMDYVDAQTNINHLTKFRQQQGYMLFSDMLPLANTLPDICFKQKGYADVLVDELQDLNHQQREFVYKFMSYAKQFTGVGDPRQSIYSFQGCDAKIFDKLVTKYPEANVYPLTTNYRCTEQIIGLANLVLTNELKSNDLLEGTNKQGDAPVVYMGAEGLVEWINYNHRSGVAYKDMAILYRARTHTPDLEVALSNAGIPYQVDGSDFFELGVVRDITKYFYLLYHPKIKYEQWRDLTKHFMGFSSDAAEFVWDKTNGRPLNYPTWNVPPTMKQWQWTRYVGAMSTYKDLVGNPPALAKQIAGDLYDRWAYLYGDSADSHRFFIESADAFIDWTYKFGADGFQILQTIELHKQNITKEEDCVQVMTVHKSKGREWPCVAVWSLKDGLFPHKNADLEEEHRLLYVAITRAQEKLALIGLDETDRQSTVIKYLPDISIPFGEMF